MLWFEPAPRECTRRDIVFGQMHVPGLPIAPQKRLYEIAAASSLVRFQAPTLCRSHRLIHGHRRRLGKKEEEEVGVVVGFDLWCVILDCGAVKEAMIYNYDRLVAKDECKTLF